MKNTTTALFTFVWIVSFAQKENTYQIESRPKPVGYLNQFSTKILYDKDYGRDSTEKSKKIDYRKNPFIGRDIEKTSKLPDSLVYYGEHPFLTGILKAYQEHRPFAISPDIVWLLISQGFARHITNNCEELRKDIVNFDKKKVLVVSTGEKLLKNPNGHWENIFPQFTNLISDYTGKDLIDVLTANFTTTTPITKIASQITVMEAMKNYFDYKVIMIGCGIPSITIEGTAEDWEKVLDKTKYVSKFKLDWWTSELTPIIQNIIDTKKSKFDKNFWLNMVKYHNNDSTHFAYGSKGSIDGWIVKFYPYTIEGKKRDLKPIEKIESIAPELVKVPFILEDNNDPKNKMEYKMEFWAGFIGLSQNTKNFRLKPEIGWAVGHVQPKE